MLAKRSRPVIGKLAGTWGSGNRTGLIDSVKSPRSPLEVKVQSPRGLKNYDLGGIGLGIVVALEKSIDSQARNPVIVRNLSRSSPVPAKSPANYARYRGNMEEMELENSEDYTFVTCHGSNDQSYTRVYCDGIGFDRRNRSYGLTVFDISPPPRFSDDTATYPDPDFLSSCHLCQKKLHGKDIYMYRGEKAFCSTECRYRQIVMDERKEKQCSSEASRSSSSSADVSSSPYTKDQIFSTGILAI